MPETINENTEETKFTNQNELHALQTRTSQTKISHNNLEFQENLKKIIEAPTSLAPSLSQEGGFKLSQLEIFNWGTFDGKIWKVKADGQGALITGENGSGKSTLVDCFLTLLVANNKRNYSLSSGNGRRERSESTYVRGAYGREREVLGGLTKTKYCREESGHFSVLLAQFQNYVFNDTITLAQVFWYDRGELKKFYITSLRELSIEKHFSDFQTPQELRKRMKSYPTTQIFDNFSDYQMNFISHFGPKSLKAMDLFNQVVAIKEVGNLSDFVRKHMLEVHNVQSLIDQLYLNYENLNLSYQAILQARSQLEILNPIGEFYKSLNELKSKQEELKLEEKKIPLYFSLQRKNKLVEQVTKTEFELEKKESQQIRLQHELNTLVERKEQIVLTIKQDDAGQNIEKIEMLTNQFQEKKKQRHQIYSLYESLAKKLNLSTKADLKSFSQNREKLKDLSVVLNEESEKISEKIYETRKVLEKTQDQIAQIAEDLVFLKKTKGNIPSSYLKLREDLSDQLGIQKSELPFIAELIQIKTSEKNIWNIAIEKLLRSFGLRLLVPHDLYTKVNKYLSKTSIGIKLIYNKVDLENQFYHQDEKSIEKNTLFEKLEFHSRSPYTKWLKIQIAKDFDYLCTDDFSRFQNSSRALMPSGLIKRSSSLHEKDDRFDSHKFQSLLGWDNSLKLNELQERHQLVKRQEDDLKENILSFEKQSKTNDDLKMALRDLKQINDFSTIDWEFCLEEIEKLQKHKDKLSHGSLSSLRKDYENLCSKEIEMRRDRDHFLSDIAVLKSHLSQWPLEIQMCNQIIEQIIKLTLFDTANETLFKNLEKTLQKRKVDLSKIKFEEIALLQRELIEINKKEELEIGQKINTLSLSIIKKMTQFKIKFSESSTDLQASLESLPDFLSLLEKLQKESLPEHENRFKKLLNKSVVNDMAAFKSTLESAYEEISESVEELNESLKKIPYSENSHVQLFVSRSKDVEIREFSNLLRNALKIKVESHSEDSKNKNTNSNVKSSENSIDLEESFNQIKKILDRMKKEENWCKIVTDVRNWADFFMLELDNSDGSQKNYYADSSGLSGGQKAKLAFTILASAIAYQYGIHKENSNNKSFRFVVIDEAFSKSDEKNSRYAMNLFNSLGLQLFVVTPKDKIHVVEPYVKNIFLTHINEDLNYSKLTTLTIDEFRNNL